MRQNIWPKRPKLDGPAYEYAQNKLSGIRMICVSVWSIRFTRQ